MGVARVQTVTVYIFRCQLKCAHYPDQALSEARGFPCGYGWVRARVAGLGEPESASPVMEVFFCRAWETTPYERGLIKSKLKTSSVATSLHLYFFHHTIPPSDI